MTLIVGAFGHLLADSASKLEGVATEYDVNSTKIYPVQDDFPKYKDGDKLLRITHSATAGGVTLNRTFLNNPKEDLADLECEHFVPGKYLGTGRTFVCTAPVSTLIFRLEDGRFFTYSHGTEHVRISQPTDWVVRGSGSQIYSDLIHTLHGEDVTFEDALRIFKWVLLEHRVSGVWGDIQILREGRDDLVYITPSFTDDDRKVLVDAYRTMFYRNCGITAEESKDAKATESK